MKTKRKLALVIGEAPDSRWVPPHVWEYWPAFVTGDQRSPHFGRLHPWIEDQVKRLRRQGWDVVLENAVTIDRVMDRFDEFDAVVAVTQDIAERLNVTLAHDWDFRVYSRFHGRGKDGPWFTRLYDEFEAQQRPENWVGQKLVVRCPLPTTHKETVDLMIKLGDAKRAGCSVYPCRAKHPHKGRQERKPAVLPCGCRKRMIGGKLVLTTFVPKRVGVTKGERP